MRRKMVWTATAKKKIKTKKIMKIKIHKADPKSSLKQKFLLNMNKNV